MSPLRNTHVFKVYRIIDKGFARAAAIIIIISIFFSAIISSAFSSYFKNQLAMTNFRQYDILLTFIGR